MGETTCLYDLGFLLQSARRSSRPLCLPPPASAWDQTNKVLFFDSATSPNAFWVPLTELNFAEGAAVMKLTMAGGSVYAGNAASRFEPANPFAFMPAQDK